MNRNRTVSNILPDATWPSSVTICIALSVFSRHYLPDAALLAATQRLCCHNMLRHLCDASHRFMCGMTKCGTACVSVAAAPSHRVTLLALLCMEFAIAGGMNLKNQAILSLISFLIPRNIGNNNLDDGLS